MKKLRNLRFILTFGLLAVGLFSGCGNSDSTNSPTNSPACPGTAFIGDVTETPTIDFTNIPQGWAVNAQGKANNVNPQATEIALLSYTNAWYGPYAYNSVCSDGTWRVASGEYGPGTEYMVLLVDNATYKPGSSNNWSNNGGVCTGPCTWNPSLDIGVLAWTMYPAGQVPTGN